MKRNGGLGRKSCGIGDCSGADDEATLVIFRESAIVLCFPDCLLC